MNPVIYPLWEGEIPFGTEKKAPPVLTYYKAEKKTRRSAFLILPGGAYIGHAPHEGEAYARFLNEHGYDACVLNYRCFPYHFPIPLLDARRAVRVLRDKSEELGIDPDKIIVMGSSAGGHLAALLSTYRPAIEGEGADEIDKIDPTPNGTVLCYSITTLSEKYTHLDSRNRFLGEEQMHLADTLSPAVIADEKTPPAFLVHTAQDKPVNVCNSYIYAARLREFKIPVEMHIFPFGSHGLGLGQGVVKEKLPANPHMAQWTQLLINWLTLLEF